MERLLIVWTGSVRSGAGPNGRWPRFRGGWPDGRVTSVAVFAKTERGWECVRAGKWLEWFVGTPMANIQAFLDPNGEAQKNARRKGMGWRYAWASRFEVA